MPTATVNGVDLVYEVAGRGDDPIALVHGSWVSRRTWDLVVPLLADSFRILTYDRRGHGDSEQPASQGSVREDVADLAALIEHVGFAPTWIVGSSFGTSITLRLAGERPDLFRGLIGHEPPLFSLLANDPDVAPMLEAEARSIAAVTRRIESGDAAGAARQFVETIALGPGMWAQLPAEFQQTMIDNAHTFLDEANDPEQLAFDLDWVKGFSRPALLTAGDQSPPTFGPVVAMVAGALPMVKAVTLPGAGHVPHATHPEDYVKAVTAFIREHTG